jgi:hypothetical protein
MLEAVAIARLASAQPSPPSPAPPTMPQPYSPTQANPAQAYPPQPYAPLSNCLACPAGTFCQKGYCVPATYPVCPWGTVFDGYLHCVPAGYVPYAPALEIPDPEEARILALRTQSRMRPRFTIDVEGALGFMGDGSDPVVAPTGLLLLGYRQNHGPRFGLVLRAGLLLGVATLKSTNTGYYGETPTTDRTSMVGGIVEGIPTFGPYGRFYWGPSGWLGYLNFGKNVLFSGEESVSLNNGVAVGIGFHGGFVLGDREQTVVSFATRIAPFNGVTLFLTAGVGLQL